MSLVSAERLSGTTLSSIIQIVCVLLTSERRDTVKYAVDFIKTLVGAYRKEILSAHLSELVSPFRHISQSACQHA